MAFNTPILLIVWRRPDMVSRLITNLRTHKPSHIFVACDGARDGNLEEKDKVNKTRLTVASEIDWACHLETLYQDTNLGCRRGVESAINWFFEHVEEGIILEDDCLPHNDFLPYCAELLKKYRDDSSIWMVSGDNSAHIDITSNFSYGFVQTPLIWGWATWRRAWSYYQQGINGWPIIRQFGLEDCIYTCPVERQYRIKKLDGYFFENDTDTWDTLWHISVKMGRGLCAIPRQNLISNQGVGEDATHTFRPNKRLLSDTQPILPLIHPPFPFVDSLADNQIFSKVKGIKTEAESNKNPESQRSARSISIKLALRRIAQKSRNSVRKMLTIFKSS